MKIYIQQTIVYYNLSGGKMYKISMVADLHYFSEKLSDGGKAYRLRSSSDQKCLAESGAIIDSAFETIGNSDCDAVLIAGDLSNDGERVSHEEVREKIARLAEKKPVYVVYATHDWCCDGNAKRYEGDRYYNDVETMTPPELREFYREYGENQAYDTYVTHLGASSYAVKLGGGVRFLGLNDDQDGKGHAGYSDEHFEWILKNVRDAKEHGETVIIMEHHLVLPCVSKLVNSGMMIGDSEERAEKLAEAGADFLIVGHSHQQRNTVYKAKNGNRMTQINLGALCGHPAPITTLTVTDDEYRIDVSHVEKFTYKGTEYTGEYITDHTKDLLSGLISSGVNDKQEFTDRVCAISDKIEPEKVEKLYPALKKLCSFAENITVGKAGRIINSLTFGKGVRKDAVARIKDDNLLEHIMDIYLSVFDGSIKKYRVTDPVYIIVRDVASLPKRFAKKFKLKIDINGEDVISQIMITAEEITNPKLPDNQHCALKRD